MRKLIAALKCPGCVKAYVSIASFATAGCPFWSWEKLEGFSWASSNWKQARSHGYFYPGTEGEEAVMGGDLRLGLSRRGSKGIY